MHQEEHKPKRRLIAEFKNASQSSNAPTTSKNKPINFIEQFEHIFLIEGV